MSLPSGTRLSHYEIVEPIGKGGMGEVYSARDTKLDREVAIKVLPQEFARDDERLNRFQREAKVLASLNHPGIAAIYGLEHNEGTDYLVLELVPGVTLGERIARGPIPVEEALDIAGRIAEALEEAHERGIVHRDLKPANVKLTPDDKVKVLDFGLAKALEEEEPAAPAADDSMSPTITRGTQVGVILGTAAYMSPEQAKGKTVDKRTDIFAFGAVLYEMLTGKKAFGGENASETLAAVIKDEPDWSRLPADFSGRRAETLRRCLAKNPRERLRDIGDVSFDLTAPERTPTTTDRRGFVLPMVAAALVAFVAGVLMGRDDRTGAPDVSLRFPVSVSPPVVVFSNSGPSIALSPDGSRLIYVGGDGEHSRRLYVRAVNALESIPLPDTEHAMSPAFSPDGDWVAFFANRRLQKIPVAGGLAVPIAEVSPQPRGLAWGRDGTIVFASDTGSGLSRVSENGGPVEPLTSPVDDERSHRWPHFLPKGDAVLFVVQPSATDFDQARIEAVKLDDGVRVRVYDGGTQPLYVPSGYLVFATDGRVLGARFDPDRLQLVSLVSPVLEGVRIGRRREEDGSVQLAFSQDGTAVYLTGSADRSARRLVRVSRDGGVTPVGTTGPLGYAQPRISPDGRRVAATDFEQGGLVVLDAADGAVTRPVARSSDFDFDQAPIWSPDGERIAFGSNRSGSHLDVHVVRADGASEIERLTGGESARGKLTLDWTSRGNVLLYGQEGDETGWDLWTLRLDDGESSPPTPLVQSKGNDRNARFSPDGAFVAYTSDESGQPEVYVMGFPSGGGVRRVSEGGTFPMWNPTGSELFYVALDGRAILAVDYVVENGAFRGEAPREILQMPFGTSSEAGLNDVDVFPDGRSFLIAQPVGPDGGGIPAPQLILMTNWFDDLERLVPAE